MKSPRKISKLSTSVRRQLNSYALAAGAAGVGVLALAKPAEAEIVYTPGFRNIPLNTTLNLDLNHDGIIDFTIQNFYRNSAGYFSANLSAAGCASKGLDCSNAVESNTFFRHPFAYAAPGGAKIGPPRNFWGFGVMTSRCNYGCQGYGSWAKAFDRYLGLRFLIDGQAHYGWARLTVREHSKGPGSPVYFTAFLSGYAYETVPEKPIKAGQIKGSTTDSEARMDSTSPEDSSRGAFAFGSIPDTPESASLGVLALGAQGVQLWRRR
jgi:hypothetical protein